MRPAHENLRGVALLTRGLSQEELTMAVLHHLCATVPEVFELDIRKLGEAVP
jgi:hypothetical protein